MYLLYVKGYVNEKGEIRLRFVLLNSGKYFEYYIKLFGLDFYIIKILVW